MLVDGSVRAAWRVERDRGSERSTVVVEHGPSSDHDLAPMAPEAARLAELLLDPAHERGVRLGPLT